MAPGKDRPAMPTGTGRKRAAGFAALAMAVALAAAGCSRATRPRAPRPMTAPS